MKDVNNYNLLPHNTFGIDAKCKRFVEYSSVDELQQLLKTLNDDDKPLLIIGAGSNLLLKGDYEGTVLHSDIQGMELQNDSCLIRCGAGETWDNVVIYCIENGFYGAENLSLIPGEVGASAVQNIGAYGVEAKDIIYKVEAVELSTGKTVEFTNENCGYSYRQSKFKREWKDRYIITYVTYKLSKTFVPHLDYGNIRAYLDSKNIENPTPIEVRNAIIDIRNAKLPDPKQLGNAGSFFMNPIVSANKYNQLLEQYPAIPHYIISNNQVKIPAGWLIDKCGWKGKSIGAAGVHDKQALVLVNKGGATGADIIHLYEVIRDEVLQKFGVELNPEVNIR